MCVVVTDTSLLLRVTHVRVHLFFVGMQRGWMKEADSE